MKPGDLVRIIDGGDFHGMTGKLVFQLADQSQIVMTSTGCHEWFYTHDLRPESREPVTADEMRRRLAAPNAALIDRLRARREAA